MSRIRATLTGPSGRDLLLGGAHLGALWAFAFVQPLLDLLGKNADFWVARSNTSGDILIFSIAFTLLPPLVLLLIEALVKLVSEGAYKVLHLGLVTLIAAVFFVQVEKRIYSHPAGLMILIALVLGGLVAYGLYKRGFVKQLLDVLTPAPIVFLVLFIFFSDTHKLIFPAKNASALGVKVSGSTPVVMVVFDELPTATLMDPSGRHIDKTLFPGFAKLAAQSTWYRNNTTVADFTGRAVPAIETGFNPSPTTLPISSDQPNSIFTLLGGQYRFNVLEPVTQVCPPDLCPSSRKVPRQKDRLKSLVEDLRYVEGKLILPPSLANDLPDVSATFGNFGNNGNSGQTAGNFAQDLFVPPSPGEFQGWAKKIPSQANRSFNFIHMELPHEPFHFLPNGRSYNYSPISDVAGPNAQKWAAGYGGEAATWQRHYIQTGYADKLTSLLISDLKKKGLWKKAMVVVTADHGISFDPKNYRRIAYKGNFGGVANPPLFIKYPGQTKGKVSDVHTHDIDILPTIAQQLHVNLPFKPEGRPISQDTNGGSVTILNGLKTTVSEPLSEVLKERAEVLDRARAWLGTGSATGLFDLGPRPDLVGSPAPAGSGGSAGSVTFEGDINGVKKGDPSRKDPVFLAGNVSGPRSGSLFAISVNGRIAATGRTFLFMGKQWYGAVVSPSYLQNGHNEMRVYLIQGNSLVPLSGP